MDCWVEDYIASDLHFVGIASLSNFDHFLGMVLSARSFGVGVGFGPAGMEVFFESQC